MNITSKLVELHIIRKNGSLSPGSYEFLLLKRSSEVPYPDLWQMVSGAIEKNEKAYETALRELKEETKLEPLKLWSVPNVNSFYSTEEDEIILIPVFLVLVPSDSDVYISKEHSEFKWVTAEKGVKLLAWPGQKRSVQTIQKYFFEKNDLKNLIEIKINS